MGGGNMEEERGRRSEGGGKREEGGGRGRGRAVSDHSSPGHRIGGAERLIEVEEVEFRAA